ncbi:flagellar basal body L-ring protein FlgH [Frigidibacter sp. ROC022]|uniref:flagellar basal body L-ring protein FlgH n=1 Tax=Frigidibacter sp. ROC022 TaxID=2971796 RepID=UPI00215ACE7C|nr:flagellar basal body L-ring protein FlgH [Frigidibacter sp. ROC022]MCR8724364.1 flagellar basal body L-ring protein FlgH [Frigidibacter sp. ROC022]
MREYLGLIATMALGACGGLDQVGKAPDFSQSVGSDEYYAMMSPPLPERLDTPTPGDRASLWEAGQRSLLGDRRAAKKGDILTVVISINDSAAISDTSQRARSGSGQMSIDALFGLPERVAENGGPSLSPGVKTGSASTSQGSGSVKRSEKLTLRIAATVVQTLPNGILAISGTQEVRVNFELRELRITGYVRPEDISRQNEITYDKIASARISYGGRGQITDVQQPRYGQQIADKLLPF